ncbi:transcriptional regulator SUPERMAN [Salix suchowensis]|nr:transcriptional regulator SUPERMAN [Salix suchowensis]
MMEKDSETSSDEETVTSTLRSRYMCSHCDREFESGHALSGHYNAHIAPRNGSGLTHGAPTLAVQSGVKYETGDGSSSTRPQGGIKKDIELKIEAHRSHPYERDVKKEAPRGGRLLNIMTLTHGVKINRRVDTDLARTVTNPVAEVSRKENGDTKLTSGKNGDEDLDLELRLGFGPA